MDYYQTELAKIRSDLKAYYSSSVNTERVDTAENTRIKMRLCSLLGNANKMLATGEFLRVKKEILKVFAASIVCAEDEVLFLSVTSALVKSGALSEEEVGSVISNSARHRRSSHKYNS